MKRIIKFPYKTVKRCLIDLNMDENSAFEASRSFSFTFELEDGRAIVLSKETESDDVEIDVEKTLVEKFKSRFESDKVFVDYYNDYNDAIDRKKTPNVEEHILMKNGKCVKVGVINKYVILEMVQDSKDVLFEAFRQNIENKSMRLGREVTKAGVIDRVETIFEYSAKIVKV